MDHFASSAFSVRPPDYDRIVRAALSPNGKCAAIAVSATYRPGPSISSLSLYDVEKQRLTGEFAGHMEGCECLAFSADGRMLATGCRNPVGASARSYAVRVWDVGSRKEICAFPGHKGCVECLAFSPDGRCWRPEAQTAL